MKHSKVLASIMAGALAFTLGLTACGGSSSDSSASNTEETAATTEDTSAATETTDSATTSDATTESTETEESTWTADYKGTNDNFELYYAESPDGKEALLLAYAPSSKNYAFYSGKTSNDSDGSVTLTDEETGAKVVFQITAASEDLSTISVSTNEFGNFDLKKVSVEDFAADVANVTATGTPIDLSDTTN